MSVQLRRDLVVYASLAAATNATPAAAATQVLACVHPLLHPRPLYHCYEINV